MQDEGRIHDVSDTAIWVAYYRAKETERPDALFQDPLASLLIGGRGEKIARRFGPTGRYTEWTLVSRTVIIDDYIRAAIAGGVDAVLNLGAGLDTRPYRMDLPVSFMWAEADFPHMVEYKNKALEAHTPRCRLQRVGVDLADREARRRFLAEVAPEAKNILVLTEGVIPYLTEQQVAELAEDLRAQPRFRFWITEYFSPRVYRYLRTAARTRVMANAPFRFFPADWLGFFASHGWMQQEIHYGSEVARHFGRRPPIPWWARLMMLFASRERIQEAMKYSGYLLLVPREGEAR
ncbi:MAG TPA: SAM-dependent methyltransferase [Steroidobacteraceae bacterium]|nr:SAM-dependent methyltransferase [Steroidobacteraceae bacterium]